MRYFFSVFFIISYLFSYSQWQPSEYILKKRNVELKKLYDFDFQLKETEFNENYYYIIFENKNIGYLCLRQAPSKHDIFDYMVVFDNSIKIKHIKILAYREDYGGEISARRWLSQFYKREIKDVQAISGATISVNSLKQDISKLNQEIKVWAKK